MNSFLMSISMLKLAGILFAGLLLASCGENDNLHHHEIKNGEEHQDEAIKGPHNGRLLKDNDFSIEIIIFETGIPPEFRVYAYHNQQLVSPQQVDLVIELQRTGDKTDHIKFVAQQDYLRGDTVIYEPHSFEVVITATYQGQNHTWRYDNFEGRTVIASDIAKEMGITTEQVGPSTIIERRTLTGRVQTNPNRLSHVRARYPGVIKSVQRELGDIVNKGTVLARVQSNESLQTYNVVSPINGVIIQRNEQVGETTGDEAMFVVIDHSDVWVELDVFVRDFDLIKKDAAVIVETLDGNHQKVSTIDWISPLTAHASQSVQARVVMENNDGALRPGQFIRAHVTVAEHSVPLAVRQSGIQAFRDFQVVYGVFDDTYEVRMLELGRSNRDWVEVLSGIEPGTSYVTENSYLIKADIEKSGASHDH